MSFLEGGFGSSLRPHKWQVHWPLVTTSTHGTVGCVCSSCLSPVVQNTPTNSELHTVGLLLTPRQ